jgi:hypothetical protein
MDLEHLPSRREFKAKRVSSYERSGGNNDFVTIPKAQSNTLAELKGPGRITHIWITVSCADPLYLRRLLFRAYWDGAATPAVESPLGDFFGVGHAHAVTYQCALFSTSTNGPGPGGRMAMNCWAPMPYAKSARVEIVNEAEADVDSFYYYIDYREEPSVPEDAMYFHARWRRELPTDGWSGPGSVWGSEPWRTRTAGGDPDRKSEFEGEGLNLDGKGNYVVLDTEGSGHFVGCNVSIKNLYEGWWGEGDDMFFVDGEGFPPSLHGTGTEDYFGHAWGMQPSAAHLYNGVSLAAAPHRDLKLPPGGPVGWRGYYTCYRYHVVDPVPFTRSLVMSVEHGHANNRSDDWSSVAYWYLDRPEHKLFARMPGPQDRDPC